MSTETKNQANWYIETLGASFVEALGEGWAYHVEQAAENKATLRVENPGASTRMSFNVSTRSHIIQDGVTMKIDGRAFEIGPLDESAHPISSLMYVSKNGVRNACVAVLRDKGHDVTLQHV